MSLIDDIAHVYRQQRKLAEAAAQQVNDTQFFAVPAADANSIAIIMKHVGGNLRSRWTDFRTTDGEKPDRNRDGEFVTDHDNRDSVMRTWNEGFDRLENALENISDDDFSETIAIRGEPHTVAQALFRNLAHVSHHSGQIVLLARVLSGSSWKTLSIPRNASGAAIGNFWVSKTV